MYSHCRRPLAFSYKIKHTSVIALLDIHPKELLTYSHIKTCTEIFTAALFIIGKTGKHSKLPTVHLTVGPSPETPHQAGKGAYRASPWMLFVCRWGN